MRSFVPTTLVASAALFSAAQGITITKPAEGETVDASKGFDIVWEYDSSDPVDWEIELGNPTPGKLLATDVKPVSAASGETATYTYTVKPTDIADGTYKVILDPRNAGTPGTSLPQSGEFTVGSDGSVTTTTTTSGTTTSTSTSISSTSTGSATTTPTTTPGPITTPGPTSGTSTPSGSGSVVPISGSTTITSATVISSTIVSGTFSTVVPQSTVFETTVVPGGGSTPTGTASPTTTAVQTGAAVAIDAGLGSAVLMALLPAFLL
ncbi:uncharacterized protein TRUGW13939_11030 [Talaromyces rugulosus]|uniref:Uncharacterized protein n=1 Tax=Talaromyces rugulosus TaxID=121627 RepID=A0A7H8RBM4_TALRU|nr:uncharacterized protein TRUGW13939_11030 [Talaromyces rugulosus]QKX63859.1 hypothetical protein TRUGW13939_11030 [Talaromyces rugulosus]